MPSEHTQAVEFGGGRMTGAEPGRSERGPWRARREESDQDPDVATAVVLALSAVDPMVAEFIERAGRYETRGGRTGQGDYFGSLANAIVFQQLAGRAAAAIHRRMVEAIGGRVTPEALLAAGTDTLRGAGLSRNKAAALLDLADKALDGTVPLAGIEAFDDEEIIRRLTAVRGIGPWTAEMFLLFELGRPDVWPVDDFGVRNGWSLIHQLPEMIKPRELQAAGEPFRPYRSALALYCWHAVHVSRGQVALPGEAAEG
jgi:DNA-3-methyladenine glycosylase II